MQGSLWPAVQDSLAYRENRMDFSIRLVIEPLFYLFNFEPWTPELWTEEFTII